MSAPAFTRAEMALRAYDLGVYEPLTRLRDKTKSRCGKFVLRHLIASIYPNSPRHLIFYPALTAWTRATDGFMPHAWPPPGRAFMARLMQWSEPTRPRWITMQRKVTVRWIEREHLRVEAKMRGLDTHVRSPEEVLAAFEAGV